MKNKHRPIKQANTLEEILSFLSKKGRNVWVGQQYSLEQLVKDLEKLK